MVPNIQPLDPLCTNFAPISMTVNPGGGGWSGANISTSGMVTPANFVQPGLYAVTYTVTDGPCLNSASTSFNVHKFNTAKLNKDLIERCETSNLVNLMTYVQSTVNGSWDGINVSNNSFNPAGLTTKTYEVFYRTTPTPNAQNLCDDVDTLQIALLNPEVPNIALAGPLCNADEPVKLSVSPSKGSWSETTYLNKDGMFTPTLAAIGNNAVEYVIGTATCNARHTIFISVEAFVSAQITTSKLPDLCNTGSAINLMPYVYNGTGQWEGPGIAGTTFDPSLAGKGNHTLTYTTASVPSGLCPDMSAVAVSVYSLQIPQITPEGPFCTTGSPVQLNADVQGGIYGGANTGAVNSQGLFIPASGVIGENIINYTITSGPCVAYAQTTVEVEQFISADFHTQPESFCKDAAAVNMEHYVVNPGYSWSGDGMVGNKFFPDLANPNNNNVIVYRTHSMPTPSLCPDKKEIRVRVIELPELQTVANQFKGCAPLEVWFNTPNINSGKAQWIVGDGEKKEGYGVSHIYTMPGTYSVMLNYSLEGCNAQVELSHDIEVFEVPDADFSMPEEILISNPAIQLVNKSTPVGGNNYTWIIEGQNDIEGVVHPGIEFPAIGRYQIRLIATNVEGCRDEITKTVEVKNDFNIYIPSSFSPNFDGLNDKFTPVFSHYGLDAKSFEMEIFDRWGHLIYSTTDFTKGWDGSVGNKGEPLKEGVYVYKMRYRDLDGNSYSKMGHVTMLR
jgi:gliding motility-associated-like protein